MTFQEKLRWSKARSEAISAYFGGHSVRKLQLGTGTNVLDGWLNTDLHPSVPGVFYLDSIGRFPFDDGTLDYVYSEHHIEHLSYGEGAYTLRECFRVLKPGGKIRVATPSLEAIVGLYSPVLDDRQLRYIRFITDAFLPDVHVYSAAFVINNAFANWGHQFIYDEDVLRNSMMDAGFANVSRAEPGYSDDPALCNLERHGGFINDEEMNYFETMVLQGSRP